MDAQVVRWISMLAAAGAGLGMIYGWFTYKEEPPKNVIVFPGSCDQCAEYA